MIDYSAFIESIQNGKLARWAEQLPTQIEKGLSTQRYGDLPKWYQAFSQLPCLKAANSNFSNVVSIGEAGEIDSKTRSDIEQCFKYLMPWRKGPYSIFGIDIDTEWRSDWKWDRLVPHISPLKNRQVLDVGCGNGYHMWRMHGEGASRVIGIDPSPRFVVQFYMLKHFVEHAPIELLPVGIEALPSQLEFFDTTFSMGVFYHRRSPFDHLRELKDTLKPGGELVLETLIVDGEPGYSLVPEGRYAKMNNVWFIPSVPTLIAWLEKVGYHNVRCVDENTTSVDEQRATEWMDFQSLPDFLDPLNPSKTIEGHPAPKRGIFVATKPE